MHFVSQSLPGAASSKRPSAVNPAVLSGLKSVHVSSLGDLTRCPPGLQLRIQLPCDELAVLRAHGSTVKHS